MQPKIKTYRNNWCVVMEQTSVWYSVIVRNATGNVHDKVRCDDYRNAMDYWRAFNAIAKNGAA
jgi:hypothetical protein